MSQATFYTHINRPLQFACSLVKTIVKREQKVLVWVEHQETLAILDQMLWTFEVDSFLAHDVWRTDEALPMTSDIILATGSKLPSQALPIVLNLSSQYWHSHADVNRVLELIGADESELSLARERFRQYKHADFEIEHHNMAHY